MLSQSSPSQARNHPEAVSIVFGILYRKEVSQLHAFANNNIGMGIDHGGSSILQDNHRHLHFVFRRTKDHLDALSQKLVACSAVSGNLIGFRTSIHVSMFTTFGVEFLVTNPFLFEMRLVTKVCTARLQCSLPPPYGHIHEMFQEPHWLVRPRATIVALVSMPSLQCNSC